MSPQRILTERIATTALGPAETAIAVAERMNGVAKGLGVGEYISAFQVVPIDGSSDQREHFELLVVLLIEAG